MPDSKKLAWADAEMNKLDTPEGDKALVRALLHAYWGENHENENPPVLEMFCKLAQGEPLTVEDEEWRWLDAKPGNVYVRDVVRVRNDAYPRKDARNTHNGRTGVVVGIRYGTVSVHYTDANEPPSSFVQHRLPLLEKRY